MKEIKLIAAFDGWNPWVDEGGIQLLKKGDHVQDVHSMKYNSSWDWLMPVIEKVKSVTQEPEELDTLRDTLWWGSMEDIFNEVVDYIKRINSGEIETAE